MKLFTFLTSMVSGFRSCRIGALLLLLPTFLFASSFSVESPSFHLRTDTSSPIAAERDVPQTIAYSTRWDVPEAASIRLTALSPSGSTQTFFMSSAPAEGAAEWTPSVPGYYVLNHSTSTNRTVTFRVGTLVNISFHGEDGVPALQVQQFFRDAPFGSLPPSPTREGFVFAGWWTAKTGGMKITPNTIVAGQTSLYAQWTANPPSAPTGVSASDGTSTSAVTVTWNSVSGARSYQVFRATSSAGSKTQIGTATATSFTDSTATPGVLYHYWVKAVNPGGAGAFSSSNTGYRKLTAPVLSSCSGVESGVSLQWSAVKGATHYRICRTSSATGSKTQVGTWQTGLTFTDTTGTAGTMYHYFIQAAVDSSGTRPSDFSASRTGTKPLPPDPPTAPTGVSASDGASTEGVTATWNMASGATSYQVYRATGTSSSKTQLGSVSATSFVDETATPGVLYYYWVKASNAGGASPFSSNNSGYRKLAAPAISSISGSPSGVTLRWSAVTGASHYRICRAESASGSKTLIGSWQTALTFTDTTGTTGTTYHYFVQAATDASGSRPSTFSGSRPGAKTFPPPDAPTNVLASDGTSTEGVTVTWTVVDAATSYHVYRATSSSGTKTIIGTASSARYEDTSASPGVLYYYWVKAVNTEGSSGYSSTNSGYRKLAAPTIVLHFNGASGVTLRWDAVPGATHYRVCRAGSASGTKTQLVTWQTGRVYTDALGTAGNTYYYFVQAACSSTGTRPGNFNEGAKYVFGTIVPEPVYRFYSPNYKGHFFTIDGTEKDGLIAGNRNWNYEGVAYRAFTEKASGTVALYRFYSKNYRGHFFTIDEEEAETIRRTNKRNWNDEGIAYYVYPQAVEGSVPVYRFWSDRFRHHFYTIDEAEKDGIIARDRNWTYEGEAFWALPEEGGGQKAMTKKSAKTASVSQAAPSDGAVAFSAAESMEVSGVTGAGGRRTEGSGESDSSRGGSPDAEDAAPWSLVALPLGVRIGSEGVTEIGGAVLETRGEAPEAEELGHAEVAGDESHAESAEDAEVDSHAESAEIVSHAEGAESAEIVSHAEGAENAEIVSHAESAESAEHFRLALPPGLWNAMLWSAKEGVVADETAEGAFDFELPASGAWHWLRVRDPADEDADDAYSLWLRAE